MPEKSRICVVGKQDDAREILELSKELGLSVFVCPPDTLPDPETCSGIWFMPAAYPQQVPWTATPQMTPWPEERLAFLTQFLKKGGKAFVEFDYPGDIFNKYSPIRALKSERLVINQNEHELSRYFSKGDLLDAHRTAFVPISKLPAGTNVIASFSRVSGFDYAVYGMADPAYPGIVELPLSKSGQLLYSTFPLSSPAFRRFKPWLRWRLLLAEALLTLCTDADTQKNARDILGFKIALEPKVWCSPGKKISLAITIAPDFSWSLEADGLNVKVKLGKGAQTVWLTAKETGACCIKVEAEFNGKKIVRKVNLQVLDQKTWYRDCLNRAADWYKNGSILMAEDGSQGVLEGFKTGIDLQGNQERCRYYHRNSPSERADCNIQSAMAFFASGKILKNEKLKSIGEQLFDFSRREFQYRDESVYRGLWRWFRYDYEARVVYSDDNGWCGFFSLFKGAICKDAVALESGLETAEGIMRTWGANGHRFGRIDWETFFIMNGRKGIRSEKYDKNAYRCPHLEAPTMALMALASWVTGNLKYLDVCKDGLLDYVSQWPEGINLSHAENDDGSKLAIALLFAWQASGDTRYREGAIKVLKPFIKVQEPCGAIPEIDRIGKRRGLNRTNDDYGTFESSVFQNNGDPVTDLMYGSSFLALALRFAGWMLPAKPEFKDAADQLTDYLSRIQIQGTGRPFLDGAWMRSFDYKRWEYFGAAGDWGWGPYCVETGWNTAIIMLAMGFSLAAKPWLPDDAEWLKARCSTLLETIEEHHTRVESVWRQNTPLPVARELKAGEPDLMI